MAAYESNDITKVFPAPNGTGGAVLPVVEKPGGGMKNLESGAGGGLAVEGVAGGTPVPVSGTVTATVDVSTLATQVTAAAILAKLIAAPATEGKQDTGNTALADILAKLIAAPSTEAKQDTAITALGTLATHAKQDTAKAVLDAIALALANAQDESDNIRGQLALDYIVPIVTSESFATPCDAVSVAVDDYEIAYESPDGAWTYLDAEVNGVSPSLPVDDWTDNLDGTYTHGGAAAFVDALSWNSTLTVGSRVLVKYTTSGGSAGTIQAKAGTAAGAASAFDAGAVTEVLTVAANMTFSLTPSADYDGTVGSIEVYPFTMPLSKNTIYPIRMSAIKAVCTSAGALVAAAVVRAGWYRKP